MIAAEMRRRCLVILMAVFACHAFGQGKRPFTVDDLMKLKRIGNPVPSPNGKWILFTAVDVNLQENRKALHLWIIPLAGGAAHRLTSDREGEAEGRWSPDGRNIVFVSGRERGAQLWVAGFDNRAGTTSGEMHRITNLSTQAGAPVWSPDGNSIAFVSRVYPDCDDDTCNSRQDNERVASSTKALMFSQLPVREGTNYIDFKQSHLFVVPARGGTATDLTPGNHSVPPNNLEGPGLYAVSPDGQEIAFAGTPDDQQVTNNNSDIYILPMAGGQQPRKISTSPGVDTNPTYSPDGRYLAWRTQERAGDDDDRFRLVVYDRQTQRIRSLTKNFDRWVEMFTWSLDSSAIYFTADDSGEKPIYRVALQERGTRQKRKPARGQRTADISAEDHDSIDEIIRGSNDGVAISADGRNLVFTRRSATAPSEIYRLPVGSKQAQQLTHLNDAELAQVALQPLERFQFSGSGGDTVEGFLLKPPGFDAQRKYPVKLLIHGGPVAAWGEDWFYTWQNPQIHAATGYIVVMINFHGSLGYGQRFIDAIKGDWGGSAYEDLMRGLDFVEGHYPYVDKTRECALGASYGGYMVNWILGHTQRFKCLVSKDGSFNLESTYGTFPELWFPETELSGAPWTNRAAYRKWSPHEYAADFRTPTLVIHAQRDYLLDVSEGLQLFTTLQRLGVPSKMLYFPDDGHFIQKPQNDALLYRTVDDWVDQWTKIVDQVSR